MTRAMMYSSTALPIDPSIRRCTSNRTTVAARVSLLDGGLRVGGLVKRLLRVTVEQLPFGPLNGTTETARDTIIRAHVGRRPVRGSARQRRADLVERVRVGSAEEVQERLLTRVLEHGSIRGND